MWTKEKQIKTEWEGHTFEFTIRTITYGEKLRLINDATVTKLVNGKEDVQIDNMKFQAGLLKRAVKEIKVDGQIHPSSIQTIEALPPEVGEFLYNEAYEFCGLFRGEQTEEENTSG